MGNLYSWVRHDWCPNCFRTTEQTRWNPGRGASDIGRPNQARCNECEQLVPPPSLSDIPGFPVQDDDAESPQDEVEHAAG